MDHCDHGICYVSGRHGGVWLEDDPDDVYRLDLVSRSFLMEQLDGYTVVLIAGGILFSYPVTAKLLKCTGSLRDRYAAVWEVLKYLGVLVLLFLCVCSLAGAAYNPFIYFRF